MRNLLLPTFQQDVTFFGWMALVQMLNGYPSSYQLSKQLLQNGSAGTRLDFPSHLDNFCLNTNYAFGDPLKISEHHTVLPYFLRFRPDNLIDECLRLITGTSVENLKFLLGLPSNRANEFGWLKLCPSCVESDLRNHGFTVWNRKHQLPSALTCTKHGDLLRIQPSREAGTNRTKLIMPDINSSKDPSIHTNAIHTLSRLSELSSKALCNPIPTGFDASRLNSCYRYGLSQQGLLTRSGLINTGNFVNKVSARFGVIRNIYPYSVFLGDSKIDYLLKLVRKPRGHHHPVAHMLMIDFLFGNWELFLSAYRWESQFQLDFESQVEIDHPHKLIVYDERIAKIANAYSKGNISLKKLCNINEIDISTAIRTIEMHGLASIVKRPKKLTSEKVELVFKLLSQGKPLQDIANLTNLSLSSIDRVCASNQEVHIFWKNQRVVNRRNEHRAILQKLLENIPSINLRELKTNYAKDYHWLVKNDKEWLIQFSKKIIQPKPPRKSFPKASRVDWNARDEECLAALLKIGIPILETWERLRPSAYLRRLPKLSFTPRFERLPKSRSWVDESLKQISALR